LVAACEALGHLIEMHIGQAVAVVGEEDLLILDMFAYSPKPFADIAPDARIDEGDAPVFLWFAEELNIGSAAGDDAIGVLLGPVPEEEILDDVCLVAEAENEVAVTVLAVILHHMPENGLMADRYHRLRDVVRVLANPGTQAAAEKHDLH